MVRPDTVKFELKRYEAPLQKFENDLVAQLPGLLITQFTVPPPSTKSSGVDITGLRFDFLDDWYSIVAFLDNKKRPTGDYLISAQSPLYNDNGTWKGTDLPLGIRVFPGWHYVLLQEKDLSRAVGQGWLKVYAAANAREALHKLCKLLDEHCLPQEVMDAVGG